MAGAYCYNSICFKYYRYSIHGKGRTDILMKLGILGMILYMSAFIAGVQFNIITFAKFYFIANVINFLPAMFLLMKLY